MPLLSGSLRSLICLCSKVLDLAPCSGMEVLQHILGPCKASSFFKHVWEQRVLLVRRPECPTFFESWFTKGALEALLRKESLSYTYNIDVTIYDGQVRGLLCLPTTV